MYSCMYICIYMHICTDIHSVLCMYLGWELIPYLAYSGLCAHTSVRGDMVHWNWLVLTWDGQWCISFPSSVFNDFR